MPYIQRMSLSDWNAANVYDNKFSNPNEIYKYN